MREVAINVALEIDSVIGRIFSSLKTNVINGMNANTYGNRTNGNKFILLEKNLGVASVASVWEVTLWMFSGSSQIHAQKPMIAAPIISGG